MSFLCQTEEIISHYLLLLGILHFETSSTIWPRLDLNSQFLCVSVLAFWVALMRHTRPRSVFLIPLPCAFGFNYVTFFFPHSGTLTNRTPRPFVKRLLGTCTVGLALLLLWRQGSPLEYTSLGLLGNENPVFCSGCDWRCEWGCLSSTAVPTWSRPKELSTIDWYHKPLHVHILLARWNYYIHGLFLKSLTQYNHFNSYLCVL